MSRNLCVVRLVRMTSVVASVSALSVLMSGTAFAQRNRANAPGDDGAPAVYTGAQAERGEPLFRRSCGNCHGIDLKGAAERAPALAGEPFMKNWETRTLASLFTKIKTDMPRNQAGTLSDETYLDIVAYILKGNSFPAGPKELNVAAMDGVSISLTGAAAKKGIPNFAMVEVVGCLVQGPNNTWMLANASEPAASKDQPATPDELKTAEGKALGTDSFQLVSVIPFKPDPNKGHKIQARGLLYKMPNDNRLDVTSLQTVSSSCGGN